MSNELALKDGDLPAIFELAEKLVPTGMLPSWIKQPGQAVAIILAGRELGMEPMRALRSLQMVQGKVVEAADSQLGRFKAAGGRATFVRLDDTGAELKLTHPNGDEHTETFTIAQAKAAGLTSKDIWQKYPRAMIRSRVITAGLKSCGWDGAVGEYDTEEAEEIGRRPEPTVRMPRAIGAVALRPEPGVDALVHNPLEAQREHDMTGEVIPAESYAASTDLADQLQMSLDAITPQQRKKLFATLKDSAHTELDFRTWMQEAMGLTSTNEILKTQVDKVLRRLEDPTPLSQDYADLAPKAQWRRRR